MKPFILVAALLLALSPAFAGMRRDPVAHAITSPNGRYVFAMIPGPKGAEYAKGHGVCYEVATDGSLKAMWRTEGWYSEGVQLDYDGKVLARIGSWGSGDQEEGMKTSTLAVAFYKEGKLTKSYKVSDLVKDESKLVYTDSGLMWLQYELYVSPAIRPGNGFQLITLDGIRYRFDMNSGKIFEHSAVKVRNDDAE